MPPPPARERVTVCGTAREEVVRRGTASEHTAVVLETADGERLILQRVGGNPFDDAQTRSLAGHRIEVEGYRVGRELRYVEVRDAE